MIRFDHVLEGGDTKRYLWQLLTTAVQGTDRTDERILQFHGGMSDEQREEVQIAFNGPPDEYPVRSSSRRTPPARA